MMRPFAAEKPVLLFVIFDEIHENTRTRHNICDKL